MRGNDSSAHEEQQDELTIDDLKWLYTAITRATEKVYLVNFKDELFGE